MQHRYILEALVGIAVRRHLACVVDLASEIRWWRLSERRMSFLDMVTAPLDVACGPPCLFLRAGFRAPSKVHLHHYLVLRVVDIMAYSNHAAEGAPFTAFPAPLNLAEKAAKLMRRRCSLDPGWPSCQSVSFGPIVSSQQHHKSFGGAILHRNSSSLVPVRHQWSFSSLARPSISRSTMVNSSPAA